MKTAISIEDDLFDEVERYAKEHHFKRSEVFAAALRVFFDQVKARQMLEALNEAYAGQDTTEDRKRLKSAKKYHAKRLSREAF